MTTIIMDGRITHLKNIERVQLCMYQGKPTIYFHQSGFLEWNDSYIRHDSETLIRESYNIIMGKIKLQCEVIDINEIMHDVRKKHHDVISKEEIEESEDLKSSARIILRGTLIIIAIFIVAVLVTKHI